jgi:hypothetical protein
MKKKTKHTVISNKLNEILAKRKLSARFQDVIELAVENVKTEARATNDPDVKEAIFQVLDIKSRSKDHKRVPIFLVLAVCCFFTVIFQPPANEMLEIILGFEFCLVASVFTQDAVRWNTKFEKDRLKLARYENFLKKLGF